MKEHIKSKLIIIASKLIGVIPLPEFAEDYNFKIPKYMLKDIKLQMQMLKDIAIELRHICDNLD